jgi:hypothetical protein
MGVVQPFRSWDLSWRSFHALYKLRLAKSRRGNEAAIKGGELHTHIHAVLLAARHLVWVVTAPFVATAIRHTALEAIDQSPLISIPIGTVPVRWAWQEIFWRKIHDTYTRESVRSFERYMVAKIFTSAFNIILRIVGSLCHSRRWCHIYCLWVDSQSSNMTCRYS